MFGIGKIKILSEKVKLLEEKQAKNDEVIERLVKATTDLGFNYLSFKESLRKGNKKAKIVKAKSDKKAAKVETKAAKVTKKPVKPKTTKKTK